MEDDTAMKFPVTPIVLEILLSLLDGDRHGYGIMKEVESRTEGAMTLRPGSLYRAIMRLLEAGLIREIEDSAELDGQDERRRRYAITPEGTAVAREEVQRLEAVVRTAKSKHLLKKA